MAVNKKALVAAGFILTIVFQLSVVGWEYLSSVWPLWFGKPVTLKIEPVDPRSLFRGNYVNLNYDISEVPATLSKTAFQKGDVAYITLAKRGRGFVATRMTMKKPGKGVFIRGRVKFHYEHARNNRGDVYFMNYGIEAYFMPKKKAEAEERRSNKVRFAEVYILPNGRAAIHRIQKR